MRFIGSIVIASLLALPAWGQDELAAGLRLDVQHYDLELELVPENSYLKGQAKVRFTVLEDSLSLPFELNSRISLIQVRDEEDIVYPISFDNLNSSRMLIKSPSSFKAGTQRELTFEFDGTLESEAYAYLDDTPRSENAVVDPDGALLLDEGLWFPSHRLPLDAATLTLQVSVPLGYTVVAPGNLEPIETLGVNEVFTWQSSLPLNHVPVSVARYFRQRFEAEDKGFPVTFYVTGDSDRDLEPLAREVQKIADFFQKEYGEVKGLSGLNLVQLGNVEVSSSGSLGLILLEARLLRSQALPLMELARRVALQWWGYSLQVEGGQDVWLQDGFANYAALRYMELEYPERYETERAKLAVEALKYEERAPVASGLQLGPGTPQYQSIVGAKGAWILYMLGQLMGTETLHTILTEWYQESRQQPVSTSKLLDFVNRRADKDYGWFFMQWLESTGVPEFRIDYTILKKSEGGFKIRGQIKQDLELFRMPVDVLIETKGQPETEHLNIGGKSTSFSFETETMPLRMMIDPSGKILRDSDQMREAVHIALGEEYRDGSEYVSAIREFELAKSISPRSSLAHYRLGETFFLQHSYSNAANSFRDALNGDLKPEWVETWTHIHLGKIYDILGQRQRALAEYQKAVNSQIDYNGAQQEAQKYLKEPFSKPRTVISG